MPIAPRRPCPGKGPRRSRCPNLIARGASCCPECEPYQKQQVRRYDKARDNTEARRWHHSQRMRIATRVFLNEHPLCVLCEKERRVVGATCVDHIIPHRGDYDLFWNQENWQSLCTKCHSVKTAKEDGGFGNR